MPRGRTKGFIPVLLVVLAVAVFGRVRSKSEREAPSDRPAKPVATTPIETRKTATVLPAPVRSQPARPDNKLTAKVVGVHDGDTITVLTADREQVKIRLDAIDAPELGQACGQASKKTLSGLVFGRLKTAEALAEEAERIG